MFFFSFFLPFFPWAMKSKTILCNWLSVIISLYVQIDVLVVSKRKCVPTICWRPEEKIHRKPNKIRGKDPTLAFETGPLRLSRLRVVKVLWQKLFCPVSTLVHWFHPGFVQRAAGNGLRFATGWGWGFSESPRLDPTDRLDLASSTCRPRTWQRDAGVMFGDFFSTVVKPRMINHPQNPPVVL